VGLAPRPEAAGVRAVLHGGIDYGELEELGLEPSQVLDFSANLNPFGPAPVVQRAVRTLLRESPDAVARYPDSLSLRLRRALAERLAVDAESLVVGNGSTELIRLLALAYFGRGDRVLLVQPTFGEYEVACRIAGASVVTEQLSPGRDFELDVDGMVSNIGRWRPKGVFLCNPNNPTGRYLPREAVERIVKSARGALVVLDEAYITFVDETWDSISLACGDAVEQMGSLVVLRSMTKDYGMAGLRLGYAVAGREVICMLRRICPPWNVNALAQEAAIAAIGDDDYLERTRKELSKAKRYLVRELSAMDWPPVPSEANFFLVRVGDAGQVRRELLKRGLLVRDCTSFGLGGYVRIAARSMGDCRRLVAALKEVRGIRT
jgi:histidinol-phosphate aminotransferase